MGVYVWLFVLCVAVATAQKACDAPDLGTDRLCYDAALAATRPVRSGVFVGTQACCPMNVTGPLVVPANWFFTVGATNVGAPQAWVHGGGFTAGDGATITLLSVVVWVRDGNVSLGVGARVTLAGEDSKVQLALGASSCLAVAANVSLVVEDSDGPLNASFVAVTFNGTRGCVSGAFANASRTRTTASGSGTSTTVTSGLTCLEPVGIAVFFGDMCTEPPPPPPSPNALNSWFAPAATPIAPSATAVRDSTLVWAIGGCAFAVIAATIVIVLAVMRSPAIRQRLFPFRGREYFWSQYQRDQRVAT